MQAQDMQRGRHLCAEVPSPCCKGRDQCRFSYHTLCHGSCLAHALHTLLRDHPVRLSAPILDCFLCLVFDQLATKPLFMIVSNVIPTCGFRYRHVPLVNRHYRPTLGDGLYRGELSKGDMCTSRPCANRSGYSVRVRIQGSRHLHNGPAPLGTKNSNTCRSDQ